MRFRDVLDCLAACSRAHVIKRNPSEKKPAQSTEKQCEIKLTIPYTNALVIICPLLAAVAQPLGYGHRTNFPTWI